MNSFQSGFESLHDEIPDLRLEGTGRIPSWLTGNLVRNGPALFETAAGPLAHWFDGWAMLHRFSFGRKGVRYANRFVASEAYRAQRLAGRLIHRSFGSDPKRSWLGRVLALLTDNTNVNVIELNDQWLALTETAVNHSFDLETLTTGSSRVIASAGQLVTAHPQHDPLSGEWITMSASFGLRNRYHFWSLPKSGGLRRIGTIETDRLSYVHSFAVTEHSIVLVAYPFVMHPLPLALGRCTFLESFYWQSERGTTVTVIDRSHGRVATRLTTEPFFAFHHANAFEHGNRIIMDLLTYPDAAIVSHFALTTLRNPTPIPMPVGTLTRLEIDPEKQRLTARKLSDAAFDFPRIHPGRNTQSYRYLYGAGSKESPSTNFIDQLVKVDLDTEKVVTWREDACYPGEPVFIPKPNAAAEDDGMVTSVVFDGSKKQSSLLVLDGRSFEEIARFWIPHIIPFGFHGQFSPKATGPSND